MSYLDFTRRASPPPTGKPKPARYIAAEDQATIPTNYVSHTLATTPSLPPITLSSLPHDIEYTNLAVILGVPLFSLILSVGLHTPLSTPTLIWSIVYYFATGLGITAGYHRLWAHRSYNASVPLQYALAILGAGAIEGSIKWWSRGHRAHHRYTDTELDPYNAHRGFWYSHVGWMVLKPRRAPGAVDVSDLGRSRVVRWQHRHFIKLIRQSMLLLCLRQY